MEHWELQVILTTCGHWLGIQQKEMLCISKTVEICDKPQHNVLPKNVTNQIGPLHGQFSGTSLLTPKGLKL